MSLPKPEPGLVIRYSYLWLRNHLRGDEEGDKDRPCVILLALHSDSEGIRTLVVPVTHSPPTENDSALEIPFSIKEHLGLDQAQSWVVLTESNLFRWPGPDLVRLPGQGERSIAYGFVPPRFFNELRNRFLALEGKARSKRVLRTE